MTPTTATSSPPEPTDSANFRLVTLHIGDYCQSMSVLRSNVTFAITHLGGHDVVAEKLQLPPITVRKWMLGIEQPSQDHIAALARTLGVPATIFQYGDVRSSLNAAAEK